MRDLNFFKSTLSTLNYWRQYLLKKYFYTINHKRLGLNYFYFSLVTALSGTVLATAIRLEMAYPGSSFFSGDSLRYLQVITAHALIMIFFVVVPIFFGGFANFLLPYHVGSKDVAFPRLNSLGFWIQPCGYLLVAKIGFTRTEYWLPEDRIGQRFILLNAEKYRSFYTFFNPYTYYKELVNYWKIYESIIMKKIVVPHLEILIVKNKLNKAVGRSTLLDDFFFIFLGYAPFKTLAQELLRWEYKTVKNSGSSIPLIMHFWRFLYTTSTSFWVFVFNSFREKRRQRFIVRCSNAGQTVAGWTFITPFSSKTKFTGTGVQDMLILGVYFTGISTTIGLVNLLATRRCLAMSGLRNRRILLSFISITLLLMFRTLAIITPILGSAMLMLLLDRHWDTSFFDFSYGGDPIFFHHLFWFFGHPEVYVLVIPAFGVINALLPHNTYRRIASKHHLIWAIYIMNYMGFLVWGHHMYLIGLDHRSRALYSTLTIMISLPATIKVVNWTYTLLSSTITKTPVLFGILSFIFFFLVAGFTGMWLSHVSLNISMHDTLYVVAHFHLMLSGAVVMAIFTGFYSYFLTFFQVKYSRNLASLHLIYYTAGQWLTFLPLFWVSFSGLPRRLHDYPSVYMGWQSMATAGHFVTLLGVIFFYSLLLESHIERKLMLVLFNLIPRFNKRKLYYKYNILLLQLRLLLNQFLIYTLSTTTLHQLSDLKIEYPE